MARGLFVYTRFIYLLKLSLKKFENFAKAFYDIGKYAFTALVIGQFLSERFNLLSMVLGIIFTSLAFVTAVKLEKIKEEQDDR